MALSRRPHPGGPPVPIGRQAISPRKLPAASQVLGGSSRVAAVPTPALDFRQVTDLAGSVGTSQAYFAEPSASNNGSAVWETGNWFDALSSDGGQSFSYTNPFTAFSPANTWGGFCCDQHTLYDPSRDLTFWLLQYQPDNYSNNGLRLAVAKGQANLEAGNWYYFDLTPQQFGVPAGHLFDYPQLALGSNELYLTSNLYTTNFDSSNFYLSLILRIPLNQLANPGSALSIDSFSSAGTNNFTFTPVQGATTTMFWASHNSTSSLRIYHWGEGSPSVAWDDVSVTAWPNNSPWCPGPDGLDWCARSDSRVKTGWFANGQLGFMWNASQGTGGFGNFLYPYVHVAIFDASTFALLSEPIMASQNYAFVDPAVAPNASGAIAGPVFYGGGQVYPSVAVFIWDSYSTPPPPWELHDVAASNADPGASNDQWGDFLTVNPHSPDDQDWVATGFYLVGAERHPLYIWFERDLNGVPTNTPTATPTSSPTPTPTTTPSSTGEFVVDLPFVDVRNGP